MLGSYVTNKRIVFDVLHALLCAFRISIDRRKERKEEITEQCMRSMR